MDLRSDGSLCRPGDRVAAVTGPGGGHSDRGADGAEFPAASVGNRDDARASSSKPRAVGIKILDTRKTIPGLRALAKYAVVCGGGVNHRVGLYDGILIKDNHIAVAGGVTEAVRRVRAAGSLLPIEVEADTLDEVDAAVAAGADIVMLDNMDDETVRAAILRIARPRARRAVWRHDGRARAPARRQVGADYVSIGAITHSAPAVDLSLEVITDRTRTDG